MGECGGVGQFRGILDEGLGVLGLDFCAHGGNGVCWVVEHLACVLHRRPLVAVAFTFHRAAMVADAGVQQVQAGVAPGADGVNRQICHEALGPVLLTLVVLKKPPALRPVATRRCVPTGRTLCAIAPVAALKARVGLADVVQKGQHRQARVVGVGQAAAGCLLQGALHSGQVQQAVHDGGNVRHVICQAVCTNRSINLAVELAPRK